jgi:DNA invertase Pin-like site-specific DNA recombinase
MEGDMAVYGYARVSTDGQSLSAQLAELKASRCEKIFQEKISGARSDRKQLARLMVVLAKGDVLVAPDSIDWRGQRAIYLICWGRLPKRAPGSNP